jgi:hypothetical protein
MSFSTRTIWLWNIFLSFFFESILLLKFLNRI